MEPFVIMTPQELEDRISAAVAKAIRPLINEIRANVSAEQPKPRSEVMKEMNIRDIRTFRKRVKSVGAISCGKIGREPAYYMSQFQTAA